MKPQSKTHSTRRLFLRTALLLMTILVFLEAGIRLMQHKGYLDYQKIPEPANISIDSHPFLPYVWKANLHREYNVGGHHYCMCTNSRGIIGDKEFTLGRQPGIFRIMCLGGSTTYNPGPTYDTDWPHLLGRMVQDKYPEIKVEVLNLAGMGYTLAESMVRFITLGQRYEPDLLIIFHGTNDVIPGSMDNYVEDYSHFKKPYRKEAIPLINYLPAWEKSRLYSIFRYTLIRLFGKSTVNDFYWPPYSCKIGGKYLQNRKVFKENLETIIAVANMRGTKTVLTQWNYCRDYKHFIPPQEYLDEIQALIDITESVAQEFSLPFLRIQDKMSDDEEFYTDWCHYTDAGLQQLSQVFFIEFQQDLDVLIRSRIEYDKKSF